MGHAMGLAHVTSSHKNLTMAEIVPSCTSAPRSLGRGDVGGLASIY
jgi:hypothetical protein